MNAFTSKLASGVSSGSIASLAKAITLAESTLPAHHLQSGLLVQKLKASCNVSRAEAETFRIGITGPPGVGKSTFIDRFASHVLAARPSSRVAVLAIDPSSQRTGGSILGDKTRMRLLSQRGDGRAYVRPSAARGSLGGLCRATGDSVALCEAAGFDVVLVETVGVGQSEVAVAQVVDCVVLLEQPAAGDELQAMKRGVMELADLIVVNKADGELLERARRKVRTLQSAVRLAPPSDTGWTPMVLRCSSAPDADGADHAKIWQACDEFRRQMCERGHFERRRREQRAYGMWTIVGENMMERLRADDDVREQLPRIERAVRDGEVTSAIAAHELIEEFLKNGANKA